MRKRLRKFLAGTETGPKRDLVVVNAAAGFVVSGLANEMNAGIAMAREEIDSGRALEKLRRCKITGCRGRIRDGITDETAAAN
jgi:Anthranilate phosphoribosyltransferase